MDLSSNHSVILKNIELKEKELDVFKEYLKELKNAITVAFSSNDPILIYHASIVLGQIDNLKFSIRDYEQMKANANKLPELEISKFYDYRDVIKLGLDIVLHFINGGACKCLFYHKRANFFVEKYELAFGYIMKSSQPTFVNYELFYTEDFYECTKCGAKLIITNSEGGHYPYSTWKISD